MAHEAMHGRGCGHVVLCSVESRRDGQIDE